MVPKNDPNILELVEDLKKTMHKMQQDLEVVRNTQVAANQLIAILSQRWVSSFCSGSREPCPVANNCPGRQWTKCPLCDPEDYLNALKSESR